MAITLQGSDFVDEGKEASYRVVLDSASLADGDTVEFSLLVSGVSASQEFDFAEFTSDALIAGDGLGLALSTDPFTGAVTVRITNNTGSPLGAGNSLVSFSLSAIADRLAEPRETYVVDLGSISEVVINSRIQTTIRNVGGIIVANTDPAQWTALSGNTTVYEGIASLSEARRFTVSTGDSDSRVFLTDAIAYANLNLGNGDNDVSILVEPRRDDISSYVQFGHGAYFARITAGNGNDVINIQSAENVGFVRANPQSIPGYELSDYYQSIVDVGAGDDYVYAFLPFQSQFLGGDGLDIIFFYGRFSDWSYEVVDATENGSLDIALSDNALDYSVWTVGANISSTARNNRVQGFEFVQFNDILLKVREAITISGPATVGEGSAAVFAISLAGAGLRAQESVTFDLQVASLSATTGLDYTELAASFLRAAGTSVKLDVIAFDPVAQTLRAVVTANRDLATGTVIASLSIPTVNDAVVEGPEQFSVTLSGFIDPVAVVTTLVDNDPAAITLSGPASVAEGATTTPYTVSLSGVGLSVGQSVTFTLDTASGSATEGIDFAALVEGSLVAAAGVTLSGLSTGANGVITVTATNTSASDLATGAALLSFSIATTADVVVEANETFTVSLGSSTAAVTTGMVTTTITDNDAAAITLSGPATVAEGATTTPYTVSLSGVGLGVGQSVTFTLDTASGSTTEGIDFAALVEGSLVAAAGVTLSGLRTGANGVITVTATNTSTSDLATGAALLSFLIASTADVVVEGNETFTVTLGSSTAAVTTGTVTTTITDANTAVIRLDGSSSVVEGANANYAVSLDGVGLGVGQSVTLTLDSASGTALEGVDFAALAAGGITAGAGVTLSGISTDPVTKAVTLTATNSSGGSLTAGSQLLSVSIPTTADLFSEGPETFAVSLSSATATVSAGSISTSITDNNPLSVRIAGPASVAEGSSTAPYTISLGSGVGLGAGASVSFSIDTASGTATEGVDFAALVAGGLSAASGISLVSSTAGDGRITITATNTGGADLAAGSALVAFGVATTPDLIAEANETFSLNLVGGPGVAVEGPASVVTTITDDDAPALALTGDAAVAEGAAAAYALALDGVGLGAGRSVTFTLDSASGTATEGADFAALTAAALTAATGISLSGISTAANGAITATATNTSGSDLAVGASILSFSLAATGDSIAEGSESYTVSLGGANGSGTVSTTITDANTAVIRLDGSSSVVEGANASYAVTLDGVGLGAGQSVTLTLDSASGTATEGVDFAALVAGGITAGSGVTLSGISTDPVTKAVTLTATNSSGATLAAGAQLLSISIPATADAFAEAAETFSVSLSSASATVSAALITTTIGDNNPLAVRIAGPASVAEGSTTSPYTISLASGVGLGAGRSVTFSIDTASGTATKGVDFAALKAAGLSAASGITLSGISTSGDGTITVTASNSSGVDLAAGSALMSFPVGTINDRIAEDNEAFSINLAGGAGVAVAGPAKLTTTISDDDPLLIQLSGPQSLTEGQRSQPYILSLGPVGLAVGQSMPLQIGLRSGSAQAGADLSVLGYSQLKVASGLTMSDRQTLADGTLSFSLINRAKLDLDPRSQLLSFQLNPLADKVMEGPESFTLRASLQSSVSSEQQLAVSIADLDKASLALRGPASVNEGALTKPFSVELGTAALAQGQQLELTLGVAGLGGASVSKDYQPLTTADLQLATGLSIAESRQLGSGGLQLQLLNGRSQPIPVGTALVQFRVQTNADELIEKGQAVAISLTSKSAQINSAESQVRTAIVDTSKPAVEPPPDNGGDGGSVQPPPSKVINGTPGPDVLVGSSLNNVIYGGKGADLITGGGGSSNVFRFSLQDGLNQGDVITDFRPGSDLIRVEGVSRNSLAATAFGGKTSLRSAGAKTAFEIVETIDGADRSKAVFLYARLTGDLLHNANGSEAGFGKGGGVIAALPVLLSFDPRDLQLAYA